MLPLRLAATLVVFFALSAPAAEAASLPAGGDGERPGPPLLYEPPPKVPQLSNQAPFAADPLLISGTDAYRDGEYLYQDYLFDDRGANTAGGAGTRPKTKNNYGFSPTAGDYLYPTDGKYGRNAADIVEFRVTPTPDAIVYRVTLNTVKADDATVVGIGIDTDRGSDQDVAWADGAGMRSPGLDRFITAWGTGGKVTQCAAAACSGTQTNLPAGAVTIDQESNQMTIRVPRNGGAAAMEPGVDTWRYVMGAGVYNGSQGFRPPLAGTRADEDQPDDQDPRTGGGTSALPTPVSPAPAVFNLAFRFDEPQAKTPFTQGNPVGQPPTSGSFQSRPGPYDTFPGIGNWYEDKQANQLRFGTTRDLDGDSKRTDLAADVNFSKLAGRASEPLHNPRGCPPEPAPATCEQARIMTSSTPVPEGVRDEFPQFGGPLQPYTLTVPPGGDGSRRGLTFSLHSLDATYTQYGVFSPNQLLQFGDQRDDYVVTTLGRGFDGWYMNEGERDFFDAWRDVAARFPLDSERVALTGYSMGGYGTYKLGVEYPDLFGRAFTTVGPPARGVWTPPAPPRDPESFPGGTQFTNTQPRLESVRWVPFLNWIEMADDLVPFSGPKEQQRRFDALGLRSRLLTFQGGEHLTLATVDGWKEAADFLGEAEVKRDPSRVSYAFMPDADAPDLGLVHDHAYWVSDLRVRDRSGDPGTNPARGEVDVRSLAFGEGDPSLRRIFTPARRVDGPPDPFNIAMEEGTDWTGLAQRDSENALDVRLENVDRARIAGSRARLDSEREIKVRVESDGDAEVRLDLQLPADSEVRRDGSDDEAEDAEVDADGATFRVGAGASTFVIARRKPAMSGEPAPGFGARRAACLPRISRLGSRGIGPVRLGRTRAAVLVAAGLPARSARRVERFCLRGGGKLLVSFSRKGRVSLVVVIAPGPLARGIGRGSSVRRLLGRYPAARSALRGVLAPPRGSAAIFGVKGTRVRFLAVADRRLRDDPALLASHLRRLGLR